MTNKEKQSSGQKQEPVWKEIPQNKAPRPDNTDVGFQIAYDEMPPSLRKNRK